MAGCSLRRQSPKVGAECLNRARSVLCGGRPAMGVPTAILRSAYEFVFGKRWSVSCLVARSRMQRLSTSAVCPEQNSNDVRRRGQEYGSYP